MKELDFELIEKEMRKGKERFFSWISSLSYSNAYAKGLHIMRDLYYKEYSSHKDMSEDFDCMLSILGNVPYIAFMVDRVDKKVLRKIDHRMARTKFYEATCDIYPDIAKWMLCNGCASIYEPYLPSYNPSIKTVNCAETLLTDKLFLNDYFFRADGEIPDGYKWDEGEYEGRLQYRWGDGKNAIKRKKEIKSSEPTFLKDSNFYVEHAEKLSEAVKTVNREVFKGFID